MIGLGVLFMAALACFPREQAAVCTITDGSWVLVHTTVKTDPEEILVEAQVKLEADDSYSATQESGGGEIRISRGRKEDQILEQEQRYTAVLQPEVIRCVDPALPEGTEVVLREGRAGEVDCRALVTYRSGAESERVLLEEKVRIQPVSRVIAVGTGKPAPKEANPVIGNGLIYLPTGEVLTYDRMITSLATAYCDKGLTATGTQARVGAIAVDPRVIPYGTRMFIVSKDGEYIYGIATAEDCGSEEHIYDTRIDLHFDTYAECRTFGARYCRVYFLS